MPVYKNDANLQGLWLMEEASGTRADYTSNSNDLTDNNTVGSSADAQEGVRSADFEAANSESLSITDAAQTGLDITGNLSIVLWYKPESLPGAGLNFQLVTKYLTTGNQRAYRVIHQESTGTIRCDLSSNGTAIATAIGATVLSAGTWYHIAIVYNGTDIRIYINGVLDSNGADNPLTYSSGIFNSTAIFSIGVQDSGSGYTDGLVDEVGILNRALSASEVSSVHTDGIQDPPAANGGGGSSSVSVSSVAATPASRCSPDPILRVITQDGKIVDLLEDWEIADPYWRPQIATYKSDGNYVDSAIADGSRLVFKKYANVIETIPLVAKGTNQAQAINKIRGLLQVNRQSADYWTESYEYDYVWLEVKPAGSDCRTGYARIIKANVPELNNPYGQPFFSAYNEATMDDITLIVEREPLWRGVQPGTLIGPLINVLKNPDFELWNFGVTDSQPDSWTDLETTHIAGTNNRNDSDSHSGNYALRVRVSGSTQTNKIKGITQVISGIKANSTYTVVAWVRNDGVSNGVGRILVTYSSQLELYRSSTKHGWTLYTGKITTGATDTVAISLEILTTAANTDGTVYFDSLMLLEGDWQQEAIDSMLPYMTSSHIVNHWDQAGSTLLEAGDINYVDMWDVPGDESALVRLEMINSTPDSGTNSPIVFETIRAGMRRAKDILQFNNFYDPVGVADTTASGDDRINSGTLGTDWTTVGFFTIDDADLIQHNLGRFRILARVRDASTSGAFDLEVRLRYWIGQAGTSIKTLDSVTVPNRGSWYIMDLTGNAALNWDVKGKNLPGSLGFEIQMRRATGTDQGYLDYAMVLPTDGGILFATVIPSVPLNSGLIVDNTNSSDVYGARLTRGWRQVYHTTNRQGILKNYNGALYIATAGGRLHRFQNNGGTLLHQYDPGVSSDYPAIEVFNSKLFVLRRTGVSGGEGYSTNGQTFPGTLEFTFGSGAAIAREVLALGGHLYIIGSTGANAKFWDWDGVSAAATERLTDTGLYNYYAGLGTYKNKIYFSGGRAAAYDVFEYDPATGLAPSVITTVTITGTLQNGDFVEFGGFLYWMTGAGTDDIYRFDGSVWTVVTPFVSGAPMFWNAGEIVGDRLYIAGNQGAASPVNRVMSTTDGVTWRTDFLPGTTIAQSAFSLAASQGQLFMAIGDTLTNTSGDLYVATFTENQYKVPDYQLSEFKAPNREWNNQRRHRYFFNFSREGGVDVVDDSMLVGIGVVPQFLSLVGAN